MLACMSHKNTDLDENFKTNNTQLRKRTDMVTNRLKNDFSKVK